MKIGARILAGYGAALLVVGTVGVVAYRGTTELIESGNWVAHTHEVKEALSSLLAMLKDAETGQRGFILTGEEQYLASYSTGIQGIDGKLRQLHDLTVDNENQLKRIAELEPLVRDKLKIMAETIRVRRDRGERFGIEAVRVNNGQTVMDSIRVILAAMNHEEDQLLKGRYQEAQSTARFTTNSIFVGGVTALALVLIIGILTQRSITLPLTAFMQFADSVGEGDLTKKASVASADELGQMARSLDMMVEGLKDVAGQSRLATQNLNSAAAEILASVQQQAAGTSEQAAAIQQTTTTMEEVIHSGVQISERAKQVAGSAEATSAASHTGLKAVENTTRTMEAIREQAEAVAENVVSLSERTQAVGEIITTVNDLAQQSHLLALNAAIEAAAAGEHGRSFSVIAGEVKNLADQSREATVQIRSILGDIQKGISSSVMLTEEAVKRVESGKQQADVADRTIREMTDNIQESVQAFQQIVAGSNQQQIGFTQVVQAIRDIGQASQQSAASTRQLEKAAVSLTTLAQQLQKVVERYRI